MKGNIYVKDGNKGIYLFSQTKGQDLPKILQNALIRAKDRWGDTPTLTRVIFGELVQKDVLGKTGYALSTTLIDNENFILVVDDRANKIGIFNEYGQKVKEFSYQAFIGLTPETLAWNKLIPRRFSADDMGDNTNSTDPYPF